MEAEEEAEGMVVEGVVEGVVEEEGVVGEGWVAEVEGVGKGKREEERWHHRFRGVEKVWYCRRRSRTGLEVVEVVEVVEVEEVVVVVGRGVAGGSGESWLWDTRSMGLRRSRCL